MRIIFLEIWRILTYFYVFYVWGKNTCILPYFITGLNVRNNSGICWQTLIATTLAGKVHDRLIISDIDCMVDLGRSEQFHVSLFHATAAVSKWLAVSCNCCCVLSDSLFHATAAVSKWLGNVELQGPKQEATDVYIVSSTCCLLLQFVCECRHLYLIWELQCGC